MLWNDGCESHCAYAVHAINAIKVIMNIIILTFTSLLRHRHRRREIAERFCRDTRGDGDAMQMT